MTLVPIMLGTRPIGAIAVSGNGPSSETLDAVSGLTAIAVERAASVDTLTKLEAARESERLRNALLDSVAHDLRTPLTSITAAITTLRANSQLNEVQRAELLLVIEEEAARLNHLVEQAMQMADLESHELKLDLRPHSMFEAVEMALETVGSQLRTHKVEIHLPSTLPLVTMDLERIAKVLQHLMENAAKYSATTARLR